MTSARTSLIGAIALLLGLLSAAAFLAIGSLRGSLERVSGDEATFIAMAESLALDGDLAFRSEDAARLEAAPQAGRKAVILQRAGDRIFYSKPIVYPLVAAPFYRLAGIPGLLLLNLLVLAAALWLARAYLRRFAGETAALTLVTFVGASALPAYAAWKMSDTLQVGFALAGLALCLGPLVRHGDDRAHDLHPVLASRWAPLVGAALLGLVVSMRTTHLAIAVIPVLACLLHRRWRRAAVTAAAIGITLLALSGLTRVTSGAAQPYKATRATFDPASGYPTESAPAKIDRFEEARATVGIRPVRPAVTAYASLYFLIGRHSGLVLYYPLALVLLLASLARPDRVGAAALLGALGLVGLYLVLFPHNYFGGGAAIGNRYFLLAYVALLFAPSRLPGWRSLAAVWALAAVVLVSVMLSLGRAREADPSSQSHAHAGIFRWMPYESTANYIDGSRERFWLERWELVRFADPWARVGEQSFVLEAGAPPAEIEIATWRGSADAPPRGPLARKESEGNGAMRFLVLSEARRLDFVYRDWRKEVVVPLERPVGRRGLVEIQSSAPWRRHPFWFFWMIEEPFSARVLRLSIRTPDGSPARAEVRYLGPTGLPDDIYERAVLALEMPETAAPGSVSRVPLRVRNDSARRWTSDDVLPVFLSYRLHGEREGERVSIEGGRTRLPGEIEPGEVLEAEIEVTWPQQPGEWVLAIDLVIEGLAWFETSTGEPLGKAIVAVSP
jgi:hypothetical protein